MRTIAIGDIHGCDVALEALLRAIDLTPSDTIITLGDYVDRGPSSRKVIDQLIALPEVCNFIPLLGNHELMLMRAFSGNDELNHWLRQGGRATLSSYGHTRIAGTFRNDELKEMIPRDHMKFIRDCVGFHETPKHIFVHANYEWDAPMDKQTENASFWNHITPQKEPYPPKPHCSGKTIWVGHTAQFTGEVLDLEHVICLDTYACGGGWLTAMDVDTRKVWQVNQEGELHDIG